MIDVVTPKHTISSDQIYSAIATACDLPVGKVKLVVAYLETAIDEVLLTNGKASTRIGGNYQINTYGPWVKQSSSNTFKANAGELIFFPRWSGLQHKVSGTFKKKILQFEHISEANKKTHLPLMGGKLPRISKSKRYRLYMIAKNSKNPTGRRQLSPEDMKALESQTGYYRPVKKVQDSVEDGFLPN